jgi:hypothetical protein
MLRGGLQCGNWQKENMEYAQPHHIFKKSGIHDRLQAIPPNNGLH